MKKQISLMLLASMPFVAAAAKPTGCDEACARNVQAVFSGPTTYELTVEDAAHAHLNITWHARGKPKLKPVSFEGTTDLRLRSTQVRNFRIDETEPCKMLVTLMEFRGGNNVDFYQVTLRNKLCTA